MYSNSNRACRCKMFGNRFNAWYCVFPWRSVWWYRTASYGLRNHRSASVCADDVALVLRHLHCDAGCQAQTVSLDRMVVRRAIRYNIRSAAQLLPNQPFYFDRQAEITTTNWKINYYGFKKWIQFVIVQQKLLTQNSFTTNIETGGKEKFLPPTDIYSCSSFSLSSAISVSSRNLFLRSVLSGKQSV